MWFMTFLLAVLVILILVVIMDTSMKLALMITTLYNYDTKKLFIPALLSVGLWGLIILGCVNSINKGMDGNAIDILFSMVFDPSLFVDYRSVLLKPLISSFIIGTLLQSLTYYTVNINYQAITGTVRFSIKKMIKALFKKLFKKDILEPKQEANFLSEVQRGPKKLTFGRAIITSVISMVITVCVSFGLFMIGELLSTKLITKL